MAQDCIVRALRELVALTQEEIINAVRNPPAEVEEDWP